MSDDSIDDLRRDFLAHGILAHGILGGGLVAALSALATPSAQAQDAVRAQPGNYRVVLENTHLRVLEYNSRPGMGVCGDGIHSHPPHLTVMLTPAHVHVRDSSHDFLAAQKTGDVFWSEAVTHETENVSGADVRLLIVELKKG